MKWKKLGNIFNPANYTLPNNCKEYAQSPQTLVFDSYVRVYFSTREKDAFGKFISHVAYVDFTKDFKNVLRVSDKTVIPLGGLGCFDEHGIFPANILRDKDRILAYTTGWNRKVSVSADASVGLAISNDNGETFSKLGSGPVMTAALHEPFLVCDSFVRIFEGVYHMWYIYGTRWITDELEVDPQRVYKIAHATSEDGISWKRDGRLIIPDVLEGEECQALPSVIRIGSRYHMYFCFRNATGFRTNMKRAYRLGYAYSDDLVNWTRDDANGGLFISAEGWDAKMLCYPHVFHLDDEVYMLYNGNEFGRLGFGLAVMEKN